MNIKKLAEIGQKLEDFNVGDRVDAIFDAKVQTRLKKEHPRQFDRYLVIDNFGKVFEVDANEIYTTNNSNFLVEESNPGDSVKVTGEELNPGDSVKVTLKNCVVLDEISMPFQGYIVKYFKEHFSLDKSQLFKSI